MRNLLNLINKNNHLILFIILEVLAFSLIIQNNNFQRSAVINSTNGITSSGFKLASNVKDYLTLKSTNELLFQENAKLRSLISLHQTDSISTANPFYFTPARVINNSVAKANNYLTLDKGKVDGVKKGMGVIGDNMIVGIIRETSEHFSTVISILHSKSKVSIVVKKNNHFGSLEWDGKSYKRAKIKDIPSHVDLQIGDTITTSGFSYIFPSNLSIGTIYEITTESDDKFHDANIQFIENLKEIKFVTICQSMNKFEKDSLEQQTNNGVISN